MSVSGRECRKENCTNKRRDLRGTAGQYCSNECLTADSHSQRTARAETMAGLAEAIVEGTDNSATDS